MSRSASRSAKVTLFFGDARHDFRLGIGEMEELQEKTDFGPAALLRRLRADDYKTAEVCETLRLGLIGGGMSPAAAAMLVERYAGPGRLLDGVAPAISVILAFLIGAPEEGDAPGEMKGEATANPASPTAS